MQWITNLFGAISCSLTFLMYSSYIFQIKTVVQERNHKGLHPLILAITFLNVTSWSIYGMLISNGPDYYIVIPNIVGIITILLLSSLMLFYYLNNSKHSNDSEKSNIKNSEEYSIYTELFEQPESIKRTFEAELVNMDDVSNKLSNVDKIYLVGCGSSLSTAYTVKDALGMVTDLDIDVFTGYEFYYNKQLVNENSAAIFTSQSGETIDTFEALKRANELGIYTVAISNEKDSSMIKEANDGIVTRCGREEAILGTKTYVTQLSTLYYILFSSSGYERADELLEELKGIYDLMQKLIEDTEEENRKLAYELKDEEIFYSVGSGPNYGLAYKLAMTMLMEGALKHSCPLYSSEFKHGLIERIEKDVSIIILDSDYPSDEITKKAIDFSKNIGAKTLVFRMQDYSDINNLLSPFILLIPLEWFVFYLAHYNGEDPGSTRHIGKVRYE